MDNAFDSYNSNRIRRIIENLMFLCPISNVTWACATPAWGWSGVQNCFRLELDTAPMMQ